ncbi:acetyltransferase [Adlercreutzia sp. ZJ138]|uniref:acetyltransferase n=1 Tax=Adlercreutzia sp. ZJ138 TaxID=2709405 RepID=UPI0019822605|nr:acetyltransferase [Adlercreutzia sp. ZJ138]
MPDLKKLVLFGAGGMGREVAYLVEKINDPHPQYELLGFVDDSPFDDHAQIGGYPVLGDTDWLIAHRDEVVCTCCIGNAGVKAKIQERLSQQGVKFESLIAADVDVPSSTSIGPGCVIYPEVGLSVDCQIGAGVLLNSRTTVGHDSTIGDYSSVMTGTGISGSCHIGREVNIGGHAFLIPGRRIGDRATVAAGSVVFSHVKAGTTVLGNPAKRMKSIE